MPGGAVVLTGTSDVARTEAPVTIKTYIMCAFAAFGGVFFGYDTGWMSGVLGMNYFIKLYTNKEYPATLYPSQSGTAYENYLSGFTIPSWEQSLTTSILSAGTFFGAIIAGDVADFIGRRPTIIGGCGIFIIGCIFETASTAVGLFCAGRLVCGLGVGFISAIIILYVSEIAPKKVRGAMVAGYQFCITLGILIADCVVYATEHRLDSGSYRIPVAVQFLWALILGGGLLALPESPRYYVKKGKLDRAALSLSSVRGQPIDSEYIQDELAEIIANNEYEKQVIPQTSYIGGWTNCFKGSILKGNSNARRTWVGIGLQAMQQLTGVNFIFYFGTVFFKQLGTIKNPFFITLITALVNMCSTPVSFFLVEKLGRRTLLIYGAGSMVVMQYIVAIIGDTKGQKADHDPAAVKAMIAFICLFISSFAITWGPCAWIVIGEIFPLPIRSRGVGLSTASNWFWNCIIAVITPYLTGTGAGHTANLGSNIFWMWGSLCLVSFFFALFLVPETKGLSLEQVDKMMEEVSPWKSASWKPHSTFAAEMHLEEKRVELNVEELAHGHTEGSRRGSRHQSAV